MTQYYTGQIVELRLPTNEVFPAIVAELRDSALPVVGFGLAQIANVLKVSSSTIRNRVVKVDDCSYLKAHDEDKTLLKLRETVADDGKTHKVLAFEDLCFFVENLIEAAFEPKNKINRDVAKRCNKFQAVNTQQNLYSTTHLAVTGYQDLDLIQAVGELETTRYQLDEMQNTVKELERDNQDLKQDVNDLALALNEVGEDLSQAAEELELTELRYQNVKNQLNGIFTDAWDRENELPASCFD